MNKKEIITCIRACLNEQSDRQEMKDRGVKYKNIFDEIWRFDCNTTQGYIGLKNRKLHIVYDGSDSKQDGSADWWGRTGNFNIKLVSPYKKSTLITKKIITNARVGLGNLNAYKDVKANIMRIIYKLFKKFDVMYIEGHSKGGSIAEINAENFAFRFLDVKPVNCTNVAGNKNGNREFIELLINRTADHLKVWCERDPVPVLPFFRYNHPSNIKILKRLDVTGIKKFFWNFLPFHFSSHYLDTILKMAKKQLR